MTTQLDTLCQWCEQPCPPAQPRGRPRQYCSHPCSDSAHRERKRRMPGRNEKRCPDCYLVHAGECI